MSVNSGFPINAGMLKLGAGTTFLNSGALTNTGTVRGNGTITLGGGAAFTNAGNVAPGASPGTLVFNSPFIMDPLTGILTIEIGGTAPGGGFDFIQVNGPASLDGTLNTSLINGFVPLSGTRFNFMTFTSRTGEFATINLPGQGWQSLGDSVSYALLAPRGLFENDALKEAKRLNDRFVAYGEEHEMERPKVQALLCD